MRKLLRLVGGGLLLASASVFGQSFSLTVDGASPTFNAASSPLGGVTGCGIITGTHRFVAQSFTPAATARYRVRTSANSGFTNDNFVALYTGTFDSANPTTGLIGCNDDNAAATGNSTWAAFTSGTLTSGSPYSFILTSYANTTSGATATQGTSTIQVEQVVTVGGTVSGLAAGNSVGIRKTVNSVNENLTRNTNAAYSFVEAVATGDAYAVSVVTQPTTPNQTCSVANGSATASTTDITNIDVSCTTNTYTVGGTVSGLASGNSVVLQNNTGDSTAVAANGSFTFATALADQSTYAVTVLTQPDTPNQTCVVTNGSGTLAGANVTNVGVSCTTNTYTISGTVTGVLPATSYTLTNNGGDTLSLTGSGGFTFATPIADGSAFAVTFGTAPTFHNCGLSGNTGTVSGANVTSVSIACDAFFYVGGTASGLAPGNSVVLRNTYAPGSICKVSPAACKVDAAGTEDLSVGNGSFAFVSIFRQGDSYSVDVLTQPTTPNQTCTVTTAAPTKLASGIVGTSDVNNIVVSCTTNTYTVGGTVSGLASGNSVVLQNNAGDNLTVSANGSYTFATALTDGSNYAVTVLTQPTTPNQTCTVNNNVGKGAVTPGTGTLNGSNVNFVDITCTTNTYTVGGTVSGLASGNSAVLQNNAGDNLTVAANGSYTFATALADGSNYAVTVLTQPTSPNQTCTVNNLTKGLTPGSGVISGSNVTFVSITCTTNTYTVGGTVSGLATGNSVVLQNNAGDNLTVAANGSYTFATAPADGSNYAVTVLTQPTTPNQTCTVANASGTLAGANVGNIAVTCATTTYTVGGTVSGLATGNSVVLQNNGGDNLTVAANGSFTFATALADQSAYNVTVLTQPTTPNQVCTLNLPAKGGSQGTINGGNVTGIVVTCVTSSYTVGGSITGLAGGTAVLQLNGGNNLTLANNGGFSFSPALADGSSYSVTVLTQPTLPAPGQVCTVSNGSGALNGANLTTVQVNCVNTASPPAAPTDVVVSQNAQGLVVTWTAPTNTGGTPITSYTATAQPSGATCTVTGNPPPTTCTISGLVPGTYTVDVVANNAAGAGTAGTGGMGSFAPAVIPSSSTWSLILLGVLISLGGLWLTRRQP